MAKPHGTMIANCGNKRQMVPTTTPVCRVEMFGGLRLTIGDYAVDRFRTRKAALLLARLALSPGRAHSREELIDLIWPDMDEVPGRNNLRQALCSLRPLVERRPNVADRFIIADRIHIRLAAGVVCTDVAEFEMALNMAAKVPAQDRLQHLLLGAELYHGELLRGQYDDWIVAERRRLETRFLDAAHEIAQLSFEYGERRVALTHVLRAVAIDPLCERLHVAAMRLHAALGDSASVRRQFAEMAQLAEAELAIQPAESSRRALEWMESEAERVAAESVSCSTSVRSAIRNGSSARRDPPRNVLLPRRLLVIQLAVAAAMCTYILGFSPARLGTRRALAGSSFAKSEFHPGVSADDMSMEELRTLRTIQFGAKTAADRMSARRRHAAICIALAEEAWSCWYGRDEERWLQRFTEANEDVRSALGWLLENDPQNAVRLSGALARFWYVRGFPVEGHRWLRESLLRAPVVRTTARARALIGCAFLSPEEDDTDASLYLEALAIFRERGDRWGEAHALRHLGYFACSHARFAKAREFYRNALDIFTRIGDERGRAVTLLCISFASDPQQPASRAVSVAAAHQSLALFRRLDNPWGVSMSLHSLGVLEPDSERARNMLRRAIAAYPQGNGLSGKESEERAMIAANEGDYKKARHYFLEGLRLASDQNSKNGVAYFLAELALMRSPNADGAARLLGATYALDEKLGIPMRHRHDDLVKNLVAKLGRRRFESDLRDGGRMSLEEAVQLAPSLN